MLSMNKATCFTVFALAGLPASADLPGVLDHVPGDSALVLLINNPSSIQEKVGAFAGAINQPQIAAQVAMGAGMLMAFPGLDATGTIALVIPEAFDPNEDEPEPVLLIPVTDYGMLAAGFGGTGNGTEAVQPPFAEGETVHIRDNGDGYMLVAQEPGLLDAFGAGNMASHEMHWGAIGDQLAGESDIIAMSNIQALAPTFAPMIDEGFEQMAMFSAMAGPQAGDPVGTLKPIVENFVRDASAGFITVSVSGAGVSFDLAANFKDGSELAGLFAEGGDSAGIMEHLPDMPHLAAGAFDTSASGIRHILVEGTKMQLAQMGADAGPASDWLDMIEGTGFVVGVSQGGMMGGMLLNTTMFMQGDDSASMLQAAKAAHLAADGNELPVGKMATTWEDGAGPDGAAKWTLNMQPDPANPAAQQMQMANMMMYGASGMPAGFYAPSDNGVVQTFSTTNNKLLTDAIAAANDGGGLGTRASIAAESEHLHSNRVGEFYISAGDALNTALPMIAMFAGPVNIEVPQDLPPLAMSAAVDAGGVSGRLWLNSQTIAKLIELGEAFEGMGEDGGDFDAPPNF